MEIEEIFEKIHHSEKLIGDKVLIKKLKECHASRIAEKENYLKTTRPAIFNIEDIQKELIDNSTCHVISYSKIEDDRKGFVLLTEDENSLQMNQVQPLDEQVIKTLIPLDNSCKYLLEVESKNLYIFPAIEWNDKYLIGDSSLLSPLDPVTNVKLNITMSAAYLTWDWPNGVDEVLIKRNGREDYFSKALYDNDS